LLKLN